MENVLILNPSFNQGGKKRCSTEEPIGGTKRRLDGEKGDKGGEQDEAEEEEEAMAEVFAMGKQE